MSGQSPDNSGDVGNRPAAYLSTGRSLTLGQIVERSSLQAQVFQTLGDLFDFDAAFERAERGVCRHGAPNEFEIEPCERALALPHRSGRG